MAGPGRPVPGPNPRERTACPVSTSSMRPSRSRLICRRLPRTESPTTRRPADDGRSGNDGGDDGQIREPIVAEIREATSRHELIGWLGRHRSLLRLLGCSTSRPSTSSARRGNRAASSAAVRDADQDGLLQPVHFQQQVADRFRVCPVEIAGRFVGQQQHRLVDQSAADGCSLPLTPGELARSVADAILEPHAIQQFRRPALFRRPPPPSRQGRESARSPARRIGEADDGPEK